MLATMKQNGLGGASYRGGPELKECCFHLIVRALSVKGLRQSDETEPQIPPSSACFTF